MPYAAPTPCAKPGCPEATRGRYCDKHRREDYQSQDAARRNDERHRFYKSAKWVKLRARFLQVHRYCVSCRREGRKTVANVVDHIVPISQGGAALEMTNLQALCVSCHSRKTGRERGRWG